MQAQATQNYEVKLEIFEGPLDLLVYLTQRNELNPEDIPISVITDQYLEYLEQIGINNLSQAGEFLVMASRLMWLKARELLPSDELDEIDEMEFDLDKESLLRQMREHAKFKESAKYLRHLELRNYGSFSRGRRDKLPKEESKEIDEESEFEAGIYELLKAFSTSMKNKKKLSVHEVEIDDVTIELQIKKIQNLLQGNPHFNYEEIFKDDPRKIVIVVSFMAILELGKISGVLTQQHHQYGPIWLYSREHVDQNPNSMIKTPQLEFDKLDYIKPGLVQVVQSRVLKKQQENSLDKILEEFDIAQDQEEETTEAPSLVPA